MYTKLQVGTLWLVVSVTLTEGAGKLLDLEKHAEQFIKKLNDTKMTGRIDGWSMTADYAYWKEAHQGSQHSIISRLESLYCKEGIRSSVRTKNVSAKTCEEVLTWHIADGLRTPFDLNITVEVPMISKSQKRKTKVTLNLNNRTEIEVKLEKRRRSGFVNRMTRMCAFYSNATFNGHFVYHFKPKDVKKSPYYALPVTKLNDTTKALYKEDNKLRFLITGLYEETLCRSFDKKPKKKT